MPVKTLTVVLYLFSLIQTAHSPALVITAFYAMFLCLVFHTDSKFNVNILESPLRILAKPVNKKEPISIDVVLALHTLYEEKNIKN